MSLSELVSPSPGPGPQPKRSILWRRWQEIRLIGQDPVLAMGLMLVGLFVFVFVAWPLLRVAWQGFFDPVTGDFSVKYFGQYFDPYYAPYQWRVVRDTMMMGLLTATGGTLLKPGIVDDHTRGKIMRAAYWYRRLRDGRRRVLEGLPSVTGAELDPDKE